MKSWNDNAGDWQNLDAASQTPRYEAVARIIGTFCPGGSILDVGCGEAVLLGFLPARTDYLGIEPSKKAAQIACAKRGTDCIKNVTAEEFDGTREWDCILFNEMLYYTPAPLLLMRKYARLLRPEGIVIISILQRTERSLKRRLLRTVWPRAAPNTWCTKVVYDFIVGEGWSLEADELISKPNTQDCWRVFAANPKKLARGNNGLLVKV